MPRTALPHLTGCHPEGRTALCRPPLGNGRHIVKDALSRSLPCCGGHAPALRCTTGLPPNDPRRSDRYAGNSMPMRMPSRHVPALPSLQPNGRQETVAARGNRGRAGPSGTRAPSPGGATPANAAQSPFRKVSPVPHAFPRGSMASHILPLSLGMPAAVQRVPAPVRICASRWRLPAQPSRP